MFNPLFVIVIAIFFFLYAALNYYIGLRIWQAVGALIPFLNSRFYWLIFWVIALSYLAARLAEKVLPAYISKWFTVVGSYWLALMFYFALTLAAFDLVRLIAKFIPPLRGSLDKPVFGIAIIFLVVGTVIYGVWNARNPTVEHYEVNINKEAGSLRQLHIVMVSDIHLGTIVGNDLLSKMVKEINGLDPDIILMAGDIVDESVQPFVEQKMAEKFKELRSKYGVYTVLGNHEYIGGNGDEVVKYLQEAGVVVLRDKYLKVADSFFVVGREDSSAQRFAGAKRKALAELLTGVDRSQPIIVLDHQPSNLGEPESQGVDLQLSGHTHRGQLFPNQLITSRIFEKDWGLLQKGNFNLIVSSGLGTWGPPIRVGNKPEIVDITVHFAGH